MHGTCIKITGNMLLLCLYNVYYASEANWKTTIIRNRLPPVLVSDYNGKFF